MKFSKPYINCIPEMIKLCMNKEEDFENLKLYKNISLLKNKNQEILLTSNIMDRLMNDKTYFFTEDFFKINFIEFNNLVNYNPIDVKIECLFTKKTKIGEIQTERIKYIDDIENNYNNEFYCHKCQNKNDVLKSFSNLVKKSLKEKILDENDNSLYTKKPKKIVECTCKEKDKGKYDKEKDKDKEKHMRLVNFLYLNF